MSKEKREEKFERKQHEFENKRHHQFPLEDDFLAFNEVDLSKFDPTLQQTASNKSNLDDKEELENRLAAKYDRDLYPWLTDETLRIKDISIFLHNEILDFVNFVTPSKEDKEIRNKVATSIEEVIKGVFPDCHVFVFGSCATGLNLPNSDIDLIVYQPDVSESRMITKVADAIVRQKKCKTIDVLKNTKVPLIKITDSEFGVNVDISFNRTNGVYCVKLVKQLLQMFPELKPLMMVLKCFLKSRQLNEPYSGGVGSFLLTMMVTSFLQRQYKLGNTNNLDLGKQLLDFFKLYGTEFNYQHVGISIRDGGFYYQKYKRGWEGRDERSYERLSVENPQDPEVDIGGSAFNIKRVQRAFQHAYDTLIYNNSNSVSILKLIITSDPSELNSGWKKQQK